MGVWAENYTPSHEDVITMILRDNVWTPAQDLPCGCNPAKLCAEHARIRAVEHYHPETIPARFRS